MKKSLFVCLQLFLAINFLNAQNVLNNPNGSHGNKFEQLSTMLPTPNEYRSASGAPGPKYWQQRADYDIKCELDEKNLKLTGSETITYFNNSPNTLTYLWFQLDENEHSTVNNANYQDGSRLPGGQTSTAGIDRISKPKEDNGFGFNITKLTNGLGKSLKYTINKTMMRVDLPVALKPGQQYLINIDWNYNISDRLVQNGRGGHEYFPEDGNHLFTMAQWYPRLCVYNDNLGWQHHQFTGRGEFALTFGNFKVQMTVPADHAVASTGECQNYNSNLTPTQLARWNQAQKAKEPIEIITLEEAKKAETKKSNNKKTWIFKADRVRDFAWTSSRKYVWDAMPTYVEGKKVMCMSFYPKESYSLYRPYSTKVVAHTIKTYSNFTIPYPYPVAQSIEASSGMEYPMICFNFGRTEKDGTYSESTKNGMIGVIIHEVGHNFFPMIINNDERQWAWMDEGLNSYMDYITGELWDNKFPSRGGPAHTIVNYMKLDKKQLEPIMSNSENIIQYGPNAYSKPATALNILRETIMGRELFDFAFKEYSRRWAFKHPEPADFFRTMEDASGEDIDWFWRGWFFTTDACDISIDTVRYAVPQIGDMAQIKETKRSVSLAKPLVNSFEDISKVRNREDKSIVFATDSDPSLRDFYWRYAREIEPFDTSKFEVSTTPPFIEMTEAEKKTYENKHLYEITFSNKGGLVMPIILEWNYEDGSKEVERIPAQIWRKNEAKLTKAFVKNKKVVSVKLDPMRETADIDESNNTWGKIADTPTKFQLFKQKQGARGQPQGVNPMQKAKEKKGF